MSQLRATAARMAAPSAVVRSPAKAVAKRGAVARPAARQSVSGGGFALDMSEGDERDADFTRVA